MNSFKSFFKQDLANILAWRLAKSVEDTLNLTLMQGGTVVGLADTKMNANLVADPIFRKGLIAMPVDGTFNNINEPSQAYELPFMPISVN